MLLYLFIVVHIWGSGQALAGHPWNQDDIPKAHHNTPAAKAAGRFKPLAAMGMLLNRNMHHNVGVYLRVLLSV